MNRRELKLALSSAQRIVVMALEEADDSLAKEDLPPTSEELETVRSAIREASRAVAELERRVPGAEMSIDDFFREIGDGMVAAQQSLDRRSREYLEAGPEHAIPSVYRIPKVQAELSFALESTAKSGFNVLLFGSSKQEQERQQQKISFEIVAAPPPPEVAAQVAGASIGTVVVTNVYQRERLRAGLAAYAAEHPADHLVALTRAAPLQKMLRLGFAEVQGFASLHRVRERELDRRQEQRRSANIPAAVLPIPDDRRAKQGSVQP